MSLMSIINVCCLFTNFQAPDSSAVASGGGGGSGVQPTPREPVQSSSGVEPIVVVVSGEDDDDGHDGEDVKAVPSTSRPRRRVVNPAEGVTGLDQKRFMEKVSINSQIYILQLY